MNSFRILFALGIAAAMVGEGLYNKDFVADHGTGFDNLQEILVRHFPLEKVAADTGVSVNVILRVARELLATLRTARRVPARLVGVRLSGLAAAQDIDQIAFFSASGETERDRGLSRAIDRVRDKFGPKSIVPGALNENET